MTRGDLVDRIWTDGAEYVDENALSATIKRLRDKLGAQKYIKTVYGVGYSSVSYTHLDVYKRQVSDLWWRSRHPVPSARTFLHNRQWET